MLSSDRLQSNSCATTPLSVLAVVPALIGMWAGQVLRRAVSPATFRRWFLIMLALLGGEMLLRGVV